MHRYLSAVALSLLVAASPGCQRSEKERAAEAQREADKKVHEAERESTTRITSAEVEGQKKISAAEAEFTKTRESYRHRTQAHVDEISYKIGTMDALADKATGKARFDADTALAGIHRLFEVYQRDQRNVELATSADFDELRMRLENDQDALDAAVKHAPASLKTPTMP